MSTKPGATTRPSASWTSVTPGLTSAATSSSLPTAMMRAPRAATAVACGRLESMVSTRPFLTTSVAHSGPEM